MDMRKDPRAQVAKRKPGYLDSAVVKKALKSLGGEVPPCPFRLLGGWVCMVRLEEKYQGGIQLIEPEYDPDREIQAIVVGVGPGWRPVTGEYEKPGKELNKPFIIPNDVKVGDVVQLVERAAKDTVFEYKGAKYYFIQSWRIHFKVDV